MSNHHALSFGSGLKNPHADRVSWSAVDELRHLLTRDAGLREAWWSPHVWKSKAGCKVGNRGSNKCRSHRGARTWESSCGLALDIDWKDASGKHGKEGPSAASREALLDMLRASQPRYNLFHHTPNGARAIVLFDQQVVSQLEAKGAAGRAIEVLDSALETHGLRFREGAAAGYEVDSAASRDLSRVSFRPNAFAKGFQRTDELTVLNTTLLPASEFLVASKPAKPAAKRSAGSKSRRGDESESLKDAIERFNSAHPIPWDKLGRRCPICGHDGCFGPLDGSEDKWFCFSSDHQRPGGEVGLQSNNGWMGDSLDIEAHKAGRTRMKHLMASGFAGGVAQSNSRTVDYDSDSSGLFCTSVSREGIKRTQLANFDCRIESEVVRDDGAERHHEVELAILFQGSPYRTTVAARDFESMSWIADAAGVQAACFPGRGNREHACMAIRTLSGPVRRRTVYAHTGWRKTSGKWLYLHGDGAIGAQGLESEIETSLHSTLDAFRLPAPPSGADLPALGAILIRFLELGPGHVVYPVLAGVFRAPLGPCDFALHLSGQSGTFKSSLAALAQQFFGAGFDLDGLKVSWTGTSNFLEALSFTSKDSLIVVDDFAPRGTARDVASVHSVAERLFRAQGNLAGRGRMSSGGHLRATRYPRGLILSTGEDIPKGVSLRARFLTLEVAQGDIQRDVLTDLQRLGRKGDLAAVMSAYIQWLAQKPESRLEELASEVARHREEFLGLAGHARTPTILANLEYAWELFLTFAEERGLLSKAQARDVLASVRPQLLEACRSQEQHVLDADPVRRFLDLLADVVQSGRAHVESRHGGAPKNWQAWGWRQPTADASRGTRPRPQGDLIGWLDESVVHLIPAVAFGAVQQLAASSDGNLPYSEATLSKHLAERGLVVRGEGGHIKAKVTVGGKRRRVLSLRLAALDVDSMGQLGQDS